MCIHGLRKLFRIPDPNIAINEARRQAELQAAATKRAENQAKLSAEAARRASQTPADSEDSRKSSENRLRRLLSARGYGASLRMQAPLGQAPVAVRTLMGL